MSIYIKSAFSISPYKYDGNNILKEGDRGYERYACTEPDYDKIIDPSVSRRWSRILKMGMATAQGALKEAGNPEIDAIITGTGYGYTEDTIKFLSRMTSPDVRGMNPTAFIQSTYNSISSIIALTLKNQGYNNTFVHSGFSFESVLEDAILLLKSGEAGNVLIGGLDELTDQVFELLQRIEKAHTRSITWANRKDPVEKTGYGEGSSFFVLSDIPECEKPIELSEFRTFYSPSENVLSDYFNEVSEREKPGLILTGESSFFSNKLSYSWLNDKSVQRKLRYKDLCGEYPTASGFGLWLAVKLLSDENNTDHLKTNSIVIYNCFAKRYHSFISLKKIE